MLGTRRVFTPHAGKRELALARIRQGAGIVARNGSSRVNITQVLGGHGAGDIHMYSFFMSMEQGMQVGSNLMNDPAWASLMAEREANPAADMDGPNVSRLVAGEAIPTNQALMVREYVMPRENMAEAISMVPEIQKMAKDHHTNVTMWAPVITDDMKRVMVVYSAPDMPTLGKSIDEVGMSQEFQELLIKASQLGTLDRAWGMVNIR